MGLSGQHGAQTWTMRPDYATYKSPYGPKYLLLHLYPSPFLSPTTNQPTSPATKCNRTSTAGITAGSFGAVAGFFALFFFSDVPKVRTDIMQVGVMLSLFLSLYTAGYTLVRRLEAETKKQNMPVIGDHFVREIPPSDNPF
ncbi:MAG: hypothetical protein Q9187_005265 [Circinaria calcarea]